MQVPENTVDLRGMQGDEALDKIEDAMQASLSQSFRCMQAGLPHMEGLGFWVLGLGSLCQACP